MTCQEALDEWYLQYLQANSDYPSKTEIWNAAVAWKCAQQNDEIERLHAELDALRGQEPGNTYRPAEAAVREACDILTRIRDASDHWGGWSGTKDSCETAINLLRYPSAAPQPAIPDGWQLGYTSGYNDGVQDGKRSAIPDGFVLVPLKETEAMHDAVMALLYQGVSRSNTQALLDAYLAAAPKPEDAK